VVTAAHQAVEGRILPVLIEGLADVDGAGIAQHHVEGGVSQQEAQRVHIHAVLEAPGGEVVAEAVGAAAAVDAGALLQAGKHYLDGKGLQGLAVVGQPDPVAARLPGLGEVLFQGLPGLPADGYHPHLGALAHDAHLLQLGVEFGEPHAGQLGESQAGVEKDRDDGLVTQAQVAVAVLDIVLADPQHGNHLLVGVGLHLLVAGLGQPHAQRRALLEVLLVQGPVEEGLDHLAVVVDGARGRLLEGTAPPVPGPAVGLGGDVLHEVADVVPGDLVRVGPAFVPGKPLQAAEADLVVAHRFGGEVLA